MPKRVGYHNNHSSPHVRLASGQRRAVRSGLLGGRYRRYAVADRFWARVQKAGPDECWVFQGYPANPAGHIHIVKEDGARIYAHRLSWELAHGPIPDGLRVLHSCDNPPCVNPAHLSLGTQRDNIHDSIRKGRYNVFGIQKLNAEQVRAIRQLAAEGHLQKTIARQFGIARNTVSGIVHRKSWEHI